MLRCGVLAAVTLVLSSGGIAMAQASIDFGTRLPADVRGWKRPAAPQVFDAHTLYDYIDGGAELYISYGLVRAVALAYVDAAGDEIKVDIFDMGSAAGAFGVFSHSRETVGAEFGQGSEYASGLLTFWKSRYYVAILGYPETEASRAAVRELGRAVDRLIRGRGRVPAVVSLLPRRGLVASSVRYFRHHVWLNSHCFVSHDNLLHIGPRTEAVLGRYERANGKYFLLVVEYPSADAAAAAERGFVAGYLEGATVARRGERWAGIRRIKKRIYAVLQAATREVVAQALAGRR